MLALGFFDGVHLGHTALLREAVRQAAALGVSSGAYTFDVHPQALLTGRPPLLLNTAEERGELMGMLGGVDEVIVGRFDRDMMHMPWDRFVTRVLVEELGACHLVAGHNYRFGSGGAGDPRRLLALCRELGVGCSIIPAVTVDGVTVSSTHIRELVAGGEVEEAARYLGHPHLLSGRVVRGRGLGRRLGFPTANLIPSPQVLLPAYGVYLSRARLPDGSVWPAVTDIGVRPTLGAEGEPRVESVLLDYQGDLYGQHLALSLCCRLREERAFPDLEALGEAAAEDVRRARAYFGC